ncbi:MAG: alkaline phosphatase family protein [Anaerolineales bacterium]|nr:alkaline phosphatase family protein [Anaerolineales bacterium]
MKKVLALVLDAADPALIERWIKTGDLPNLQRMQEHGMYGRVTSYAEWLAEATPFAFYTGQSPASHGVHCYVMWDAETMKLRPPSPDWLPIRPFWRRFSEGGPRAVVLDVSNSYTPEPFHGVEIVGWATHDSLIPFSSYPPEITAWIHRDYGSAIMPDEIYGTFGKQEFIRDRDLMLEISGKFSRLCIDLMKKESWDFFLAYMFTVHHGGHRLWGTTNIKQILSDMEKSELSDALRQVYMAGDKAIGEIIDQAGENTIVMVMSMHGMGINNSRTWILPDLLRLILREEHPETISFSFVKKIRDAIPLDLRHRVKSSLPHDWRRWLTRFWRNGYDWKKTRAFTLASDTHGWIQINLKGRETEGIVEVEDYEALCEKISVGLRSFVDADTGKPIVEAVARSSQLYKGEKQGLLPDLIVRWANSPAAEHRSVTSSEFGTIAWPTPGQNPEGRSGNHQPDGFFMMSGHGINPGAIEDIHILDLAPTILSILGQPIPDEMEGNVLRMVKP